MANRILWTVVVCAVLLTVLRLWHSVVSLLKWKPVAFLAMAGALLALNWLTYVYSVGSNQIVEASLGYFINPLVSVGLGVLVLKERLTRLQWTAVIIASVGVAIIAISSGALPWIGLVLALTFGTYGLIKKYVNYPTVESLAIETVAVVPLALIILVVTGSNAFAIFAQGDVRLALLLAATGPMTAIPLLLFGAAATRIPLSTLGLLQYICPIAIFLIGVLAFNEAMSVGRWIGFGVIWIALIVFSADVYRDGKKRRNILVLEVQEPA